MTQLVKNLPAMWETWVRSLGWEDPLEKACSHKELDTTERLSLTHSWLIYNVSGVQQNNSVIHIYEYFPDSFPL